VSSDLTRRRLAWARAREGIPVSLIIDKLGDHVKGDAELSVTQIRACEILLKKAMPDLQSVDHEGSIDTTAVTAEELKARAKNLGMDPDTLFANAGDPESPTAH
jgi:hypothetical protein